MSTTATSKKGSQKHRPRATTVFAAAFLAGAAAAVGVNRALDVHLAQSVPQVESEQIFVAIRSLPKGSPVTIYDVALKEWPKAMLPSTALRADAVFDNVVLRHPLQEGQPILSLQLAQATPEPTARLAAAASAPTERERVVQSAPPQPAPAFVPYEAAAPIPVPAPIEQPQAAAAATPSPELAATAATAAASQETPEPAAVAAATPEPETITADVAAVMPASPEPAEATPASTEPAEPVAVATVEAETAADSAPPEAVADATPAPSEPTVTAQVSPPVAASTAAVAAAEPTVVEPTPAPETAVVDKPTEPTLASTDQPTPAAPAVTPVDVTAAVLAKAAAQQAEAERAEPQPAEVATAAAPATVVEAVETMPVTQPPASRGTPTPAGQQVMRYLVVPERIALQVDHSFTRPEPPTAAQQQARQPTRGQQGVRPLPEMSAGGSPARGSRSPAAARRDAGGNRQPVQQLQAAVGSIPRPARPPQPRTPAQPPIPVEQQASTEQNESDQPILRSLFPKLSAGLTAMGQEWREFRDGSREPPPGRTTAAGSRPTSGQQRSATRPQQSR